MNEHGTAHTVALLTPELEAAAAERRAPDFSLARPALWAAALDRLLLAGRFDVLANAAGHYRLAFPGSSFGHTLVTMLDTMPPVAGPPEFVDDTQSDFQLVARAGAKTLLVAFCDGAHRLGMAVAVAHRWFARLPASTVYLRDFRRVFYLGGVPSLGPTLGETVAALRAIAAANGAERIACFGNSGGVFPALLYGLELKADAVLALSGPTNLTSEFNEHLRPLRMLGFKSDPTLATDIDLQKAYATAKNPPRVLLTYGTNNWDDRIYAEYLGGLPTVELHPIPGYQGHNAVLEMIRRGEFQQALSWLIPAE